MLLRKLIVTVESMTDRDMDSSFFSGSCSNFSFRIAIVVRVAKNEAIVIIAAANAILNKIMSASFVVFCRHFFISSYISSRNAV